MLTLKTNDNNILRVQKDLIEESELLRTFETGEEEIPLDISTSNLKLIIEYCKITKNNKVPIYIINGKHKLTRNGNRVKGVDIYEYVHKEIGDFINGLASNNEDLFKKLVDLSNASNYSGFVTLNTICIYKLIMRMKEKSNQTS